MVKQILLLLFLGINAIYDAVYQRIVLWSIPMFLLPGVIFLIWGEESVAPGLAALIPGILLLMTGKITKEAIGYGDGLIVLVLGIYLGIWETCEIVLGGLFLSAVWGGFLMVVKKKNRHQEFPWIPFLLLSYVGKLVLQCLE